MVATSVRPSTLGVTGDELGRIEQTNAREAEGQSKMAEKKAQVKKSETLAEFAARINSKSTKRNGTAGISSINRRKR